MSSLIIQLDNPINITHDNDLLEVETLHIPLPSVFHYNFYADVKTVVMMAMLALQDTISDETANDTTNTPKVDVDGFPLDIFLSSGKLMEVSNAVNAYVVNVAMWDGDKPVNIKHIKKMSITDYNSLIERLSYFLFQN
jgi:hypothetical protein